MNRKFTKSIIAVMLALVLTIASVSMTAFATEPDTKAVDSVSVAENATVVAGETTTLTATVLPADATNKAVTWSSSPESVATVDSNGVVTGVAAGTATITVTTVDGGKTDTCTVTVTAAPATKAVDSVSVAENATVVAGETTTLTATVLPADATNKAVTWSSSPESVATVDSNGVVTGVAAGTATITVTTVDGGKTDTCTVTVTAAPATKAVDSVSVAETATVKVGETTALTATVLPADATNKAVTWSSSPESVATVDSNGVVTGVATGTATITVTTADGGKTDTCTVTVTAAENNTADKGLKEVLESSVTVEKGKIAELPKQVTVKLNDNTTVKADVKWNTADIPADKYSEAGEFYVYGTVTKDGVTKEAVCKVTVVDPKAIVEVKESKVSTAINTLPKLPTEVTVVLADKTTAKAKVTWESISSDALAKTGTFPVYGTVEGTDIEAKCIVTVGNASTGDDDDGDSEIPKTGESILGISIAVVLAVASFMVMVMCYNVIMKKKGALVKASANGGTHHRSAGSTTRSYVRSGRTPVRRPRSSAYRADRRRRF